MDLREFFDQEREVNENLRRAGALEAVRVREAMLRSLSDFLTDAASAEVTPEVAANLAGVHVETVRRALRQGTIRRGPDGGVLRGDLPVLRRKRRKRIDKERRIQHNGTSSRLREAAMNSV